MAVPTLTYSAATAAWDLLRRDGERDGKSFRRVGTVLLALVLAGAIAVRFVLLAALDFPIGDGALFLEFVDGVGSVFPRLPHTVPYNGLTIPFAYPPLAFWIGALVAKAGIPSLDVVRVLPIVFNIGYLLLFAALLLRAGSSRLFVALALLFFSATLRSSEWLVMGGGLSRGAGSLFCLLTLLAIQGPAEPARAGLPAARTVLAGVFVAGALLSHLEWGVLSAGAFILGRALQTASFRAFVIECVGAGLVALALVLPWFVFVMATHGPGPFLAARGTSGWDLARSFGVLRSQARSLLLVPLVPLGLVVLLRRRQFFWPLFALLCLFLTPRHGLTPFVLPVAVFFARGTLAAFDLVRAVTNRAAVAAALAALLVVAGVALQVRRDRVRVADIQPLSADVRAGMRWVADRHRGATFLLMTPRGWWIDSTSEWFPTIAKAVSVATVQGREWLPDNAFALSEERSMALKASTSCAELSDRMRAYPPTDFLWAETMRECFLSPAYEPVFQNDAVSIWRVNSAAPGR